MWILECDGDILHGKRVWLRPGKTYLFGRTKPERGKYGGFNIQDESVSRKHLTLSVSAVKPGAGSHVHLKSELRLEDEATKFGTKVDGERIKGSSKILRNVVHVFCLGSYRHLFRIRWSPVVLTFTFPSKDTKAKDPLIPIRSKLEDLDVKMILPYIVSATTHVVASKRNTAKGLQALINGKYIVDNSFLDALVYATTPGNLDELESLSPLEEDFDANWPPEAQYLPAPGREPGQRSEELFAPISDRQEIFHGYTFVFCNLKQFENLQAPITNGGGEALHFKVTMGQTSIKELVRYAKNAAGETDLGEFADGSIGKGVVLVKFQGEKGFEQWALDLQDQVAITLDQRSIEQNEFLDAILSSDASKLRRPLPLATDEATTPPPSISVSLRPTQVPQSQTSIVEKTQLNPTEDPHPPVRRGRARGPVVSVFKGFDDGFDRSQIAPSRTASGKSLSVHSPTNGATQDVEKEIDARMKVDSQEANGTATQVKNTRKRPPPSSDEDEEDISERLLPAAAAMKRRRIEAEEQAQHNGISEQTSGKPKTKPEPPTKKPKPRKEVNIQDVVRERREAEDEAARRDEETLAADAADIKSMRNLAVVEEMEVPEGNGFVRRRNANGDEADNDRWDERWNGRKNFKRFRRGGEGEVRRMGPNVIVPLEEVKKKSQGIGEEYWPGTEKPKEKEKRNGKQRDRNSQITMDDDDQPTTTTARNPHDPPNSVSHEPAGGAEADIIDVDAPRQTRLRNAIDPTQSQAEGTQTATGGKRPAPAGAKGRAPKKQKILKAVVEGSESDDDLKFRFKKRR